MHSKVITATRLAMGMEEGVVTTRATRTSGEEVTSNVTAIRGTAGISSKTIEDGTGATSDRILVSIRLNKAIRDFNHHRDSRITNRDIQMCLLSGEHQTEDVAEDTVAATKSVFL
ncbi:hypothetical protein Ciccas_014119 [Cichlidogyrus casuarinus]|uniref:Uncharacterized protein n=1 Tax=Cichlidogyrus casuarinus TaxID=1844966 RepID=A0ABD2PNR2_9PLAT